MRLIADEESIPRIHRIATILLALLLTFSLSGFYSWQQISQSRAALSRVEGVAREQLKQRLQAEIEASLRYIEFTRSRTDALLAENLVEHVDMALAMAEAIHSRDSRRLPAAEVQRTIIESLRPMRFYGGGGYYFIDDMKGKFILLPTAPQLEGKINLDNKDDQGHPIMRSLIEAAQKPQGEGFSRYRWYTPDSPGEMKDKLSYVRYFAPYDWLIGAGDYIHKWEAMQQKEVLARLNSLRFGKRGQIVIIDHAGHRLTPSLSPDLEKKAFALQPEHEHQVIETILSTGHQGGGFINYNWVDPDSGRMVPKTGYVQDFPPWGWTMLATIFDDELEAAIHQEIALNEEGTSQRVLNLLLASGFALGIGLLASFAFSSWSKRLFSSYHQQLARKEEILRQSEEHYQALADNGQALIWMAGLDQGCHYFNRPWLSFTGRTLEQESGNGWTEGVHPDDLALCLSTYATAFKLREKFSMTYRLRHHSGAYRWIIDDGTPRFDKNGTFLGYIGHCLDITEMQQAQDEIAQHRGQLEKQVAERTLTLEQVNQQLLDTQFAMDSVGIGIHWVDCETGQLAYVNKFAAAMLGYSVDEMLQMSVPDIDPTITPESFKEVAQRIRSHGFLQFESEQKTRDGHRLPVEISVYYNPGRQDAPPRFISFIKDISARKEYERALRQAKEAAEAANVSKSAFVANMSHEIRTPLNAITGMAYLIRRAGVTAEQSERLDKIDMAGKHLLEIINAILDLSKIEAGKFLLEEEALNIDQIMERVEAMLADRAHSKQLQIIVEPALLPDHLLGDTTRLQQALLNYATNAVKFTEKGHITLRTQVLEDQTENALLRFEVSDTGIGIAPDIAARLFTPFEQADNSISRNHGGTGLGLAITSKLANLMDGEAGLESIPGQGSTFWFTARLKKGQPRLAITNTERSTDAEATLLRDYRNSRILLVEDEMVNREITLELLSDVGQTPDIATDGQQAVDQVRQHAYDLILMDMQMPVMDGLEATRLIRQLPNGSQVPILAMTANAFAEDRARCLAAGMNDFIAKPMAPEALFEIILKWLSTAKDAGQGESEK